MIAERRGELLTVTEVTEHTGFTRKALRLYEDKGLVVPAGRTPAGYRLYDEVALRRLEWVRRGKRLGLTLAETKEFLHVADGCCGEHHPELAELVETKLEEAQERIAELSRLRDTLGDVLDRLTVLDGVSHRCTESLCLCGPDDVAFTGRR